MSIDDRGELDLTRQIDTLTYSRNRFKSLFLETFAELKKEKIKLKRYRRFVKYLEGGISGRKTDY